MALAGSDKAYLQARSGIARSGASRSNYVFPLLGLITVGGVEITDHILYGSLRVTLELNEQPDTASFDVMLTDGAVAAALVVGADVLIGLGGVFDNPIFGGRILTAQTTRGPARSPSVRSVMCADYLQVLDSEVLVTYDWPAQSATLTVLDLVARFANKAEGVAIITTGVQTDLPSHAKVAVANERFSTVLGRLVTMFPTGGGFYIDPVRNLHVWAGTAEPGVTHPSAVTLDSPQLKAFAETVDNAQDRDAVIVEGLRTTAPIGTPGPRPDDPTGRLLYSMPVIDASIFDKVTDLGGGLTREARVGTQRMVFGRVEGPWSAPDGTVQTTKVTADVAYVAGGGAVQIFVASLVPFTGRTGPWVRINEQVLGVSTTGTTPTPWIEVAQSGWGGMTGPIAIDAVVTVIDSLVAGTVTGRYDAPGSLEILRPQPINADVVMTVRSQLSSFSVHEQLVQDGRYSRAGAAARGTREIADFKDPIVSVAFDTEDLNAKPGRRQTYSLAGAPVAAMTGELMIISTALEWPVWGELPRRSCTAAYVHAANVLDTWLVDPR